MPLVDPVTMAASQNKPVAILPPLRPRDAAAAMSAIHLHTSPAAQIGQYLHPAALSGLIIFQFPALVEDPVRTLMNTLPLVAVIQIAYVLVCLPVAGSQAAKGVKKPKPGEKKKAETGPNPYIGLFLSLLLTALLTPALHLAFVLFGAPFLTHIPHTLLVSAILALLALFPLFYVRGVDASSWLAIGSALAPFDETFGGCAGALFGAWLGAVPIPLDWDREWQKWPVTILAGLYGGYIVGKLLGGSLLFGKRMAGKTTKEE
ncbi:glycosylphosphatidylinositol anchor biosynthesis protein [Plectosphaerella plurivora]|uniref:Glycosylphosphatidylinositol anchor biosynthesis protein n=1 Tax=Plectosphaerella plurivora TaxID=936078 RepID=A0A9P9AG53_9PEZI|nr:glycosylphosphatidylinositol anchor biosynthesis protein [Plectosphaerella plurivora]